MPPVCECYMTVLHFNTELEKTIPVQCCTVCKCAQLNDVLVLR